MSNFHTALVDRVHLFDIEATKWAACKSVLHCLANHANESERDLAWPGMELMMLETGMSESAISRAAGLLHDTGWIFRRRRYGKSNMYRLNRTKLEQHQVARPDPKAVHMAKHLPDMLFPGEKLEELVDVDRLADDKPTIPGRSTSRQRATRRNGEKGAGSAQVSEPVDNFSAEKPQVGDSSVKSTDSKTRSNMSNRRDCSRQIDVSNPVDLTCYPLENHQRTEETSSVRPIRNVRNARAGDETDGRTDDSSASTHPSQPPLLAAVSDPVAAKEIPATRGQELVAGEAIQADLARIDMRPGQRRQLATVVDRELARFPEDKVRSFLAVKAREAATATYLIKAFTLYSDEIYLATDPVEVAGQHRADAALAEALEADRCTEHPYSGRRADGSCSQCWVAAMADLPSADAPEAPAPTGTPVRGSTGEIAATTGASVITAPNAAERCVACESAVGVVREELPLRSRVCDQCWSAEAAAS
ncbi:hypothetical protein A5789_29150 [Nocardia sp. 852002-51101_SCH5132738]|uniref:hypothetical protein n=1 Tax=Nocardia sp. 852002-51101_SCH5132738 TaxID=1834095 RepID=UPI0007EA05E0|nr:hypothetical protein [Nocardia sp. 852002-51101_SCH5132738]OBA50470.1 hypothetical protein A5789_29150 [Nocardia sp. 852002-51101_SCH5132738]